MSLVVDKSLRIGSSPAGRLRTGQRIRAYVVGDEVDFDEVRVWARARTMGFKVPDEWLRIPELPRSPAGKVLRRTLPT
ncbi:MAG: hypothetical protein P4L48_05370 [Mycobacterium sp.]|nr:hypothetical protein [Mycobacterium sp.]HKI43513.1 hypothetical protein [Mycobacterium sp.]